MLGMNQHTLGLRIGLTFQQVQKYEKGTNRIGASRLQHISRILDVPVAAFFEGAPGSDTSGRGAVEMAGVHEFLATSYGLAIMRALARIADQTLRQRVVDLVERIAETCPDA
jgi:transcriptional regulator with XRE-family HTH domain